MKSDGVNVPKTGIWILLNILLLSFHSLNAQVEPTEIPIIKSFSPDYVDYERQDIDSTCMVVFQGGLYFPPPPPPPPSTATKETFLSYDSLKQALDSVYYNSIGEYDPETEMSRYSITNEAINAQGKFNPSILWETRQCYDLKASQKLLNILECKENKSEYLSVPALCFQPRLSLLLYSEGKIKGHYDICFECSRVKYKQNEESLCIDIEYLKEEIENKGFPIIKSYEDFVAFKKSLSN